MSRKSKADISSELYIIFLGIGSFTSVKNKKSTKGLFWTMVNANEYYFMDARASNISEVQFNSYEDFRSYCNEHFPEYRITT